MGFLRIRVGRSRFSERNRSVFADGRPLATRYARELPAFPVSALYRLWSSHLWLLAAQAVAVGAAIARLLIGLGLLLNTFTAKTVQYVFHIEVFYPLCLFLVACGVVREMLLLFVGAFDGASYLFLPSDPSRLDIPSLRIPAGAAVRVQGALLPHFPVASRAEPLARLTIPEDRPAMVVLAPSASSYPFSRAELREFADRLGLSGFDVTRTPRGLIVASSLRR